MRPFESATQHVMHVQFCRVAASKPSGDSAAVFINPAHAVTSRFKNGEASAPSGMRNRTRRLHVESDLQTFVEGREVGRLCFMVGFPGG